MPHAAWPGLLCQEPLSPWQYMVTHGSAGDAQTLKGRSGSISAGSLGPVAHKVLFEPSEDLWWIWGLIINMILPLLLPCWGFSFALGCGVSFFIMESNILLLMLVQQWVEILEFLQEKVSTHLSILPFVPSLGSCLFQTLQHSSRDWTHNYSWIKPISSLSLDTIFPGDWGFFKSPMKHCWDKDHNMLLSSYTINLRQQGKKAKMLSPYFPSPTFFLVLSSLLRWAWKPKMSLITSTPTSSPPTPSHPASPWWDHQALPFTYFALHFRKHHWEQG